MFTDLGQDNGPSSKEQTYTRSVSVLRSGSTTNITARFAPHDGQRPRFLQENAITKAWLQDGHQALALP
jgi:hypothetical protein